MKKIIYPVIFHNRQKQTITAIRYDSQARYAFIGDANGQITMLRLDQSGAAIVTTFKGHTGMRKSSAKRTNS